MGLEFWNVADEEGMVCAFTRSKEKAEELANSYNEDDVDKKFNWRAEKATQEDIELTREQYYDEFNEDGTLIPEYLSFQI